RRRLAGRGRRTQHRPRHDRLRTGVAHLLRCPVRGHGRLRARRRCRRGRVSARAPAPGPRLLRPVRPRGRPRSHPRLPAGDEDGTGRPGSAHIVLETDSGRILSPAEVALDCRSSDYRSAWPGPNDQVVTMGAVTIKDGKRRVVSHWAKFYRGQFAGRLLADERPLPVSSDELVSRAQEYYDVEFSPHTASKPAS